VERWASYSELVTHRTQSPGSLTCSPQLKRRRKPVFCELLSVSPQRTRQHGLNPDLRNRRDPLLQKRCSRCERLEEKRLRGGTFRAQFKPTNRPMPRISESRDSGDGAHDGACRADEADDRQAQPVASRRAVHKKTGLSFFPEPAASSC
jgi:hypothetical protein